MKKKLSILLVVLLAACSIVSLAGCTVVPSDSSEPTPPVSVSDKTPTPPKYSENTPAPTFGTDPTTEPTATSAPTGVTLEESVIYNEGDITVTVKGFGKDSFLGPQIKLLVENNSDKNITVQTRNSSINGYMIPFTFSCDVATGKKSNDNITVSSSDLEDCGIDTMADIEFSLYIFCSDDWKKINESDMIQLQTSAASTYVQQYDDSGLLVYDENNIKVVAKGITKSFLGQKLILYIENNSDQSFTIQSRDTSINGFTVSSIMSIDIMPGKKALDSMSFMNSDLEDNDISKITEIETRLRFINENSRGDSITSNIITMTFE